MADRRGAGDTRKRHTESLRRRRDYLREQASKQPPMSNTPVRRELAAMEWLVRLVDACTTNGVFEDLKEMGYDV